MDKNYVTTQRILQMIKVTRHIKEKYFIERQTLIIV